MSMPYKTFNKRNAKLFRRMPEGFVEVLTRPTKRGTEIIAWRFKCEAWVGKDHSDICKAYRIARGWERPAVSAPVLTRESVSTIGGQFL